MDAGEHLLVVWKTPLQNVQKTCRSHPPTPARRDAHFTDRGRSARKAEEVHTKLRLNRSFRSHASG